MSSPARVLIDPLGGVPSAVASRRWVLPLVVVATCVALAGVAFVLRHDYAREVAQKLGPEAAKMSEQDLAGEIQTASRLALVLSVVKGVFGIPALVVGLAIVLKVLGWLFGTSALFVRCLTTASVGLLPIGLRGAIFAVSAWRQPGLTTKDAERLLPTSALQLFPELPVAWKVVWTALEGFTLWSLVLIALGFAEASGMRRWRALVLAVVVYAAYIGVFQVGLPGLSGGKP